MSKSYRYNSQEKNKEDLYESKKQKQKIKNQMKYYDVSKANEDDKNDKKTNR